MDQASPTLVTLNLETRGLHRGADARWKSLLATDVSRWDYLQLLTVTYGFEAPLEAAFAYTPNLKGIVDLRERSRAGLAAQDLLSLGLSPSDMSGIPQCFPMAPFATPLEALGWMYVVERATLLHDVVRQHLVMRLPSLAQTCAYLSAYDGKVGARWSELGHVLDRLVRTPHHRATLIAAAHTGFRALAAWTSSDRTHARSHSC